MYSLTFSKANSHRVQLSLYIIGLFILHSTLVPMEAGDGKCIRIKSEIRNLVPNDLLKRCSQEKPIREKVKQEREEETSYMNREGKSIFQICVSRGQNGQCPFQNGNVQ